MTFLITTCAMLTLLCFIGSMLFAADQKDWGIEAKVVCVAAITTCWLFIVCYYAARGLWIAIGAVCRAIPVTPAFLARGVRQLRKTTEPIRLAKARVIK